MGQNNIGQGGLMPDWKLLVQQRLTPLSLEATGEADLTEELAQHLEDTYRELRAGGVSETEAYQQVVLELEDVYSKRAGFIRSQRMSKREAVPAGDVRSGSFLEDLARDLRYTVRSMRRSPLFVLTVVLTLALGIGANTTVFTVINTLILNPLPVRNITALQAVAAADAKSTSKAHTAFPISYADLEDYRARNEVFRSLAGYTGPRVVTWQEPGGSQRLFSEIVTG